MDASLSPPAAPALSPVNASLVPAPIQNQSRLHNIYKGKEGWAAKSGVPRRPSGAGCRKRKALPQNPPSSSSSSKPEKSPLSSPTAAAASGKEGKDGKEGWAAGMPEDMKLCRIWTEEDLEKVLSPEDVKLCRIWAEEDFDETMHDTYEDQMKREGEERKKRIECELDVSSWFFWPPYELIGLPSSKVEPEVLLPKPPSRRNSVERFEGLMDPKQIDDLYLEDSYIEKNEFDYLDELCIDKHEIELKPAFPKDGFDDCDGDETTPSLIEPGPSLSSNTPHGKPSLILSSVGSLNGDIKGDKRE